MTTGDLGLIAISNQYAITGLARDFYRRIGQHYGKFEQWIFEPYVMAERLFGHYVKRGVLAHRLSAEKKGIAVFRKLWLNPAKRPLLNRQSGPTCLLTSEPGQTEP